jgi:2'-5' RNA ligase
MSSPIRRTFLGCQVPPAMHAAFAEWQRHAGQCDRAIPLAMLHLTLCVIAQGTVADPLILRHIMAALAPGLPPAAAFHFTHVRPGKLSTALVTGGSKRGIKAFYDPIAALLIRSGYPPLFRTNGLIDPHITLGYNGFDGPAFAASWRWIPDELLLIESRPRADGRGREHIVLHRWPLLPPAQGELPFLCAA